jgi:uncharacterized protein
VDLSGLISNLHLAPHPEGGFYRETYRSAEVIPKEGLPQRYNGEHPFGTAIYYLLAPDSCSKIHRVKSDEIFHFYLGDPVLMLELFPDGSSCTTVLGQDLEHGEQLQHIVHAGTWQGSMLIEGGRFALLGTTVSPAFVFDDFELGKRDHLLALYAEQAQLITRLTK